MSFFNELKRRNVFRVGIGYAVAAWVLLQAIGFPIAVIIAWAFEMTPEGLKRESEIDRSQSITQTTGRKLDRIIIGFLALAVVFLAINPFKSNDSPPAPTTGP